MASTVARPAAASLHLLPSSAIALAAHCAVLLRGQWLHLLVSSNKNCDPGSVWRRPATPVVTTGVVVGTVPPAGEAQNVPLVVAAKSEV